ncbi:hypothetical protein C461_08159 [Halorubrum aidingense JCM 13560]|uniref:Uncharacterized protein n=1 Tax=Halorubrum aidingense JCM 13560 TaxID=1230454 RepID=M0PFX9_9EURY|nr:hypothetical protein [Halorubrum aidingense]EMA67685.1 hypothetical protein C461_08159 [Halorubrum aidingense JCM 13560]
MTATDTWAFETTRGSVLVGPSELRFRHGVTGALAGSFAALAAGRLPPVVRHGGWPGLALVTALATVAMEWAWSDGVTVQLVLGLLGVVAVFSGSLVSAIRLGADAIPLRTVEHATFEDGTITVAHRTDDDLTERTIRPRNDAERADAALALRLRGVTLRGIADDEAVSRTVVDAPKTELVV